MNAPTPPVTPVSLSGPSALSGPEVSVLGVPYDAHSSFLRGPAAAPPAIRAALTCGSANWATEFGQDLETARDEGRWVDLGDLELPDDATVALPAIRQAALDATAQGQRLLSLGGDHLVAYPLMQAMAQRHEPITIVHFDAHPDLYDELDGDRLSHACPFARIMEEGLATRLIQVGIRTITPHQREQADRFGVEVLEAKDWDGNVPAVAGPVYVSLDIDVLDPAFAPGISHFEPGGLSTRELLNALHQLRGADIIGADLVEINPERDINDMTAMVGAKLFRELLGMLLSS